MLTIEGRKSGTPHTVPVGYVLRDGAFYPSATAGGQPAEPQWREIIVATLPVFAKYEQKSGRKIAVARLTPS